MQKFPLLWIISSECQQMFTVGLIIGISYHITIFRFGFTISFAVSSEENTNVFRNISQGFSSITIRSNDFLAV